MAVDLLVREQVIKDLEKTVPKTKIKKIAQMLLNDLGYEESEVSILITDDVEMKDLNHNFRNKNETTDVLSFRLAEAESGSIAEDILGDVVISLERACQQASELKRTESEEVLFLTIHGILHLLGYDHEEVSIEEAQEMRGLEAQYFEKYRNLL